MVIVDSLHTKITALGVYGIIPLKESHYLVLMEKANLLGQILGKKIFQLTKCLYIPLKLG